MKPSTAKAKGRETENLLVEFLRQHGVPHAERRRLTGSADQGDITGWPGVCVEIKSGARVAIPQWLSELAAEKRNSAARVGFVAVRPKGTPDPDGWYVVLPLPELMDLLEEAGWTRTSTVRS
jgi:hypothetical protein